MVGIWIVCSVNGPIGRLVRAVVAAASSSPIARSSSRRLAQGCHVASHRCGRSGLARWLLAEKPQTALGLNGGPCHIARRLAVAAKGIGTVRFPLTLSMGGGRASRATWFASWLATPWRAALVQAVIGLRGLRGNNVLHRVTLAIRLGTAILLTAPRQLWIRRLHFSQAVPFPTAAVSCGFAPRQRPPPRCSRQSSSVAAAPWRARGCGSRMLLGMPCWPLRTRLFQAKTHLVEFDRRDVSLCAIVPPPS